MRHVVLAVFSLMFLVILTPAVPALATPNVTFIPDDFSANSSLIVIVDPGKVSESLIITWTCPECGFYRDYLPGTDRGSIPKVGDKWYCYFSNTDNTSNCGPVPFTVTTYGSSPYSFIVYSLNQYGETRNKSITLHTGGVELTINTTISGKTVEMTVWADTSVSGVSYAVYSADTVEAVPGKSGSLSYFSPNRAYIGNVTLDYEDYFIEFRADAPGGNFGGELVRIPLKQPGVVLPDGVVEVEDIVVEPVVLDILINRNQRFEQSGFEITNLGNVTIRNLSVEVPENLSYYLSVDLAQDTLGPGGRVFFTVVLENIQNAMGINTNVNLTSNNTFIKYIPVNITVSVINECPEVQEGCVTPTGELSISPMTWSGDFLTYKTESKIFTLTNLGNITLSNLSYATTISSIIDNVTFPSSIIPNGGVGGINVSIRSSSPGSYTGTLTIETEAGDEIVLIGANFYDDVSGDVSSLSNRMEAFKDNITTEQYNLLSDIITGIESDISSAQTRLGYSDYAGAKESYDKAYAAFIALSEALSAEAITPQPEPIDMNLVMIITAVIIIAVVAWVLIKKLRARRGREEEEFEGEEEFGEEGEF